MRLTRLAEIADALGVVADTNNTHVELPITADELRERAGNCAMPKGIARNGRPNRRRLERLVAAIGPAERFEASLGAEVAA